MALDWNKEISFGEIKNVFKKGKGGAAAAGNYPTKKTMNLYQVQSNGIQLRKLILVAVLGAVVAVAFLKFGVFDQWARVTAKESELAEVQAQVTEVEAQLAANKDLIEEYESYAPLLSSSGVDAIGVLTMIENHVMPRATVSSATLEEATLTLNLVQVPLDTVGDIVNALQEQPLVTSVSVTTAQNDRTESTATATITLTLVSTAEATAEGEGNNFLGIDVDKSADAWADAAGSLKKNNS